MRVFAYDKEKTDRYNERPWGGGFWSIALELKKETGTGHSRVKDSWNK